MNVYDAGHIRNVALVGHQGSGKTTLAESMLFESGAINRAGSVEEGNTVSDYHSTEVDRKMSVFHSVLHAEWDGHKINIIDTPGYPDFVGEVVSALKVVDTAVFVIDAVEGVQVGTELAWGVAEESHKPVLFVVNHIDKQDADFQNVVAQLKDRFGHGATPLQFPVGTNALVDVLAMKKVTYSGRETPRVEDIPSDLMAEAERLRNELAENVAENDETLMEKFFENGALTDEELRQGLHGALVNRQIYPILITSAPSGTGVQTLMNFIDQVCPAPDELPPAEVEAGKPVAANPSGAPVLFIFRTMAETHVGDYSFFRVYSGTVEGGMDLENVQTQTTERMGQLFSINGKARDNVTKMVAGDIGALIKLKNTHTNNTLRSKGTDSVIKSIPFPAPRYTVSIKTSKEGEEDKLAQGLHQLSEEDPSLVLTHDQHLKQMVLGGQGEMHLEIAKRRLKNRFGVEVEFNRPRVAYRETIQTQARSSYRHKKQTGGAGQFADISMLLEPLNGEFVPPADITVRGVTDVETAWGAKVQFIDAIVGGVIDMKRFFGPIQKGILEALPGGPVAGYPVGDVRVVVFDGGMHPVDSNENAFKSASRNCFREGFRKAQPVLLEPIYILEVLTPDAFTGDVMGDLNTRRARIQGIEAEGPFQKVVAQVPEAELFRYSTILRSLTQGRGLHRAHFDHYEAMPRNVQDKVVTDAEKELEEEK